MNQVIQERIAALRKVMEREGVDYYMVPTADFHNSEYVDQYFKMREYLSGFTGSNGTLVVSAGEAGLWTDGRYFIQAENELKGTGIRLFRMLDEGVPTIQEYLQAKMKEGQTLGFDGRVWIPLSAVGWKRRFLIRKLFLPMIRIWRMRYGRTGPGCQATRSWFLRKPSAEGLQGKKWQRSAASWKKKEPMRSC